MKKLPLLFILALTGLNQVHAQITNDSAAIKVNPGASLYLEGDLNNLNQSTITNEGTLEVKGEFNNELGSEFNSLLTAISIFHGTNVIPLVDPTIKQSKSRQEDIPDPPKRAKRKPGELK